MNSKKTIKAWKDPEFRNQLEANGEELPNHPAGGLNLSDSDLSEIFGGIEPSEQATGTGAGSTFGCCTYWRICDGLNTNRLLTYGCCP